MNKVLVVLIFLWIETLSLSLEIESVTPIKLGSVTSDKKISIDRACEIWVKGIPGKKVKLEYPLRIQQKNRNIQIDIYSINLRRDIIVLDKRGRGRFEVDIQARVRGHGKIHKEVPLKVIYVN